MVSSCIVKKTILILFAVFSSFQSEAIILQDSIFINDDTEFQVMGTSVDHSTTVDSLTLYDEPVNYDSVFPEAEPVESESISELIENETYQDSIIDTISLANIVSEKKAKTKGKIRFYQKWWFTLLIVLMAVPFVYRYYVNNQYLKNKRINELKTKSRELISILKEREKLYEKKELEFQEKFKEEEELKFQAIGLSNFSDIISKNKDNLEKLGQHLIYELVKYTEANSGAIYIMNDDKKVLNVLNSYAPELKKIKESFKPGEGYVGTCYNESKTLELENIPETYSKISSGLGEALPRYIAFIPLIQDENKLGVIELASFKKLEKYKLEFTERLSHNIASAIAIQTATEKMQSMLEQSKVQSEELKAHEEELRQNMEEMQSVQEELQRQKDELTREKALMDVLLTNAKEAIYFKDKKSRFIKASDSMAKLFKVKSVEKMYGKSDFDFFTEEHARPAFEDEMNIIKTGKPMIDKVEKETHADGRVHWVSTSKMPLYNEKGEIVGTFGISKDVTQSVEMEQEIKQRNEELQAQEEELRQNLEEMQAVQDELQRQKDELTREKSLMDALLSNAKESIYFKDRKSKFIKASDSMAKLFKVKSVEKLYGKSDFDFFTKEHARPAFKDEMNIIKTAKPIINKIEKETHPDGRVTWASTSKMPLYNDKGEIIGTFGISKDITEAIKMEMEVKQRNEELLAQEEELRQNLEEMQTIQEDLQKKIKENEKLRIQFTRKEAELKETIKKLQKKV